MNSMGPYDLLLSLAEDKSLDISQVNLATITDKFIAHVNKGGIDPEEIADFVVVASTLLLLKLKEVLPALDVEQEEEISELTDRLRIYQLYREQAAVWLTEWGARPLLPGPEKLAVNTEQVDMPNLSPDEIRQSLQQVIAKIPKPVDKKKHLRSQGRSLQECLNILRQRLQQVRKLSFNQIVAAENKETQALSLLAILEMSRQNEILIQQRETFGQISVTGKAESLITNR